VAPNANPSAMIIPIRDFGRDFGRDFAALTMLDP
jgi:hypothetical protein